MKRVILTCCSMLATLAAGAQILITSSGLTYTQDFNGLDTLGTSLTTMPAGWSFREWGGTSANTTYRAGTGSGTTGDTYSFGKTGSAERALGALCSSGVPNVNYGARFQNNAGAYINALTVTFKEEQWRRNGSGNTDSVRFYYSTAAGATIADTAFNGWIQVPALLMTSITTALPAAALNGNDTARIIAATFPVALPNGSGITLRWYDFNSAGNDDALALDSLTVVFNIGAPSAAVVPAITALSPAPDAMGVAPASNLSITFDKQVTAGAGSIYVKNETDRTTRTIAAASSGVTISGRVVTVTGTGLAVGKTYQVTFDSTAFDTLAFHSPGIYDTTAWRFTIAAGPGGVSFVQADQLPVTIVNPAADGAFDVRCVVAQSSMLYATVYDLTGRALAYRSYHAVKGDNRFVLHTSLPAGTYVIRVDDGRQWGSAKVVLQ